MDVCNFCGRKFKRIGLHWCQKLSHEPEISYKTDEIIKGLLLGDATLNHTKNRPQLVVKMTSPEYLEHIQDELSVLKPSLKMILTAAEKAEEDVKSGFNKSAKEKNYNDVYRLITSTHSHLQTYKKWYAPKKEFPNDLKLSNTSLKHWYCCDGGLAQRDNSPYMYIDTANEAENIDKLKSIFKNSNCMSPDNYYFRSHGDTKSCQIFFGKEKTTNYLNNSNAPPGFEYKWL